MTDPKSPKQDSSTGKGLELVYTKQTFNQVLDNAMTSGVGTLSQSRALRELARGKLTLLKKQIETAIFIGEHDLQRGKEIAMLNIDLHSNKMKTQLEFAYTRWLSEVGGDQKFESIKAINQFDEKVEELKRQIDQGGASPKVKQMLKKAAELAVEEVFTVVFQEAAKRILADEND